MTVLAYENMQKYIGEAEQLMPQFIEMSDSLNSGETTFRLTDATSLRLKIMKHYEHVDSLSKSIASLGVNTDDAPSPKSLQLQTRIRMVTAGYLQQSMGRLQQLPSIDKLAELQEERKQAALRRVEEERKRVEALERKQAESRRPPGPRGIPEGAEKDVSGRVIKPENHRRTASSGGGWKPVEITSELGKIDNADPMLQQINIIRSYVKQAREAEKWDEVNMLEDNLKMLQQEYWRQSRENKADEPT